MNEWFGQYTPESPKRFCSDIEHQLNNIIQKYKGNSKFRLPMGTLKRWYNSDPTIKRMERVQKSKKNVEKKPY